MHLWAAGGLVCCLLILNGCKKQQAPLPPTPPAPAASPATAPAAVPTATLRAAPAVIEQGQSTTLSWNSTNATELRLEPGLGLVASQGSTVVTPERSTTYTVVASSPGGRADASARVTVNVPPPTPSPAPSFESSPAPSPSAPPAPPQPPAEELFVQYIRDAFFDYDKFDLRPDARLALVQSAEFLLTHPQVRVLLEGHCDERGSNEYNLGLGDARVQAGKQFLVSLGVSPERIQAVSYGEERPFCKEGNEDCWQQNRRAHFILVK